jgi:hypothetical protein
MVSRSRCCLPLVFCGLLLPGCSAGIRPAAQPEATGRVPAGDFALCTASERKLFIWDMHPVESAGLARSVCERLQGLGYRMSYNGRPEFLVQVQAFASDRKPGARLAVLECLDPRTRERVWVGETAFAQADGDPDLPGLCAGLARDRGLARFLQESRAKAAEVAP